MVSCVYICLSILICYKNNGANWLNIDNLTTVRHMQKHELHDRGVKILCMQILQHTLRDFQIRNVRTRGRWEQKNILVHADYMRRIRFICESPLFIHTVEVMEYDVDKMRKSMLKIVDKKYEKATAHYAKIKVDKPYI